MPASRSADDPPEQLARLDQVANELYALTPEAFGAARDAAVRAAREAGSRELARELAKLRKPTQSAWLINQLWRDQRQVMQQLFELADALNVAQAQAAGELLRTLTTQRRGIEAALMRRAAELAEQAGVRLTDAVAREAQATLTAALAVPEVAAEVRTGRLTRAAAYAGFGVLPSAADAPQGSGVEREPLDLQAAQRSRAAARLAAEQDAAEARRAEETRRAEQVRRAAAEQQLQAARDALAQAETTLAARTRAAELAERHAHQLRERLDALQAQLQQLQTDLKQAEDGAADAKRDREAAAQTQTAAEQALQAAEQALRASDQVLRSAE